MATIKVSFETITKTTHEAAIPTVCPNTKCGADLSEPGALQEIGYIGSSWYRSIVDGELGDEESIEDNPEVCFTTGYLCAACRATLAGDES